jgi:hypothetical protein
MDELEDGMSEVFREVCENYGFSATGQALEVRGATSMASISVSSEPDIDPSDENEIAETIEVAEYLPAVA